MNAEDITGPARELLTPGSVSFSAIASDVAGRTFTPEQHALLMQKSLEKIRVCMELGNIRDMTGASDLLYALHMTDDGSDPITKDINRVVSKCSVIPADVMESMSQAFGEPEQLLKRLGKELNRHQLPISTLSPREADIFVQYRHILLPIKEKGLSELDSLRDVLDAVTRSTYAYKLAKSGLQNVFPDDYETVYSAVRQQIDRVARIALDRHPEHWNDAEREGLRLILHYIDDTQIVFEKNEDRNENSPALRAHNFNHRNGKPLVFPDGELDKMITVAEQIGIPLLKYHAETNALVPIPRPSGKPATEE